MIPINWCGSRSAKAHDSVRNLVQLALVVAVEKRNGSAINRRDFRGRTRRIAGVELSRQPRHVMTIAMVPLEFDHCVRIDSQTVLDFPPTAVLLGDLLVLVGDNKEAVESELHKR